MHPCSLIINVAMAIATACTHHVDRLAAPVLELHMASQISTVSPCLYAYKPKSSHQVVAMQAIASWSLAWSSCKVGDYKVCRSIAVVRECISFRCGNYDKPCTWLVRIARHQIGKVCWCRNVQSELWTLIITCNPWKVDLPNHNSWLWPCAPIGPAQKCSISHIKSVCNTWFTEFIFILFTRLKLWFGAVHSTVLTYIIIRTCIISSNPH